VQAHVPLTQVCPLAQQTPLQHCPVQLLPGAPFGLLTGTQFPPWHDCTLQIDPAGTAGQVPASLPQHCWHVPPQQVCPVGQVFATPPVQQTLLGIHAVPHGLKPALQMHCPPLHSAFS